MPWVTFDAQAFRLLSGAMSEFASSRDVRRGFCANCGTALIYRHASAPRSVDITTLSLDEPARLVPLYHVWVSDGLPWIVIADDLPRYERERE